MTHPLQLHAEEKARAARRGYASILPVPVEAIVKKYGIRTELAPLDDELSGMSLIKDGVAVIVLNSVHHPNRRRFTLSHELGHHLLHREYLTNNVHVDKVVLNRNEISSLAIDPKEMQANAFAAELLMPEAELKRYRSIDLNDDEFVSQLARKLKVSVTALAYRLANLGVSHSAVGT